MKTPKVHRLERSLIIPQDRERVFAFFSDARNLEAITPPFLHFQIVPPAPEAIVPGTLIDYRLRLFGVGFGWRTLIEELEPPLRFIDKQLRGPYALWVHTHEFRDVTGGTIMTDKVDYAIGWGPLGPLAHALFVRRTLDKIFDYREKRTLELLAGEAAAAATV